MSLDGSEHGGSWGDDESDGSGKALLGHSDARSDGDSKNSSLSPFANFGVPVTDDEGDTDAPHVPDGSNSEVQKKPGLCTSEELLHLLDEFAEGSIDEAAENEVRDKANPALARQTVVRAKRKRGSGEGGGGRAEPNKRSQHNSSGTCENCTPFSFRMRLDIDPRRFIVFLQR